MLYVPKIFTRAAFHTLKLVLMQIDYKGQLIEIADPD